MSVTGIKTLVVPDNAIIERIANDSQAELYIQKTFSSGGQPGEPMPLVRIRQSVGCAA